MTADEREAGAVTSRPVRLCVVCTHSFALATLYKGLFPYLRSKGFEIEIVVGDDEYTDLPPEHFGICRPRVIPMERLPSPLRDLRAFFRFLVFFARNRFDVIHVSTPKASLLASTAAVLTGNGAVMFVYRRCIYELMTGFKRRFYVGIDRLISSMSTVVVPISRQLDGFLRDEGVCPSEKLAFIGSGSSNGIDTRHFSPTPDRLEAGRQVRRSLGIDDETPVVLYLGRVCSEKGVDLLPRIFESIRSRHPETHFVVAGPDDGRDPASAETLRYFDETPNVHRIGFVKETEAYYAMCTVFLFPSFFEGFGNVLLEAASMERAAVAFSVPGVAEAVADGVSGILVAKGDVAAAAAAVNRLLDDPAERRAFEERARRRVVESFDRRHVWGEIEALMRRLAAR